MRLFVELRRRPALALTVWARAEHRPPREHAQYLLTRELERYALEHETEIAEYLALDQQPGAA